MRFTFAASCFEWFLTCRAEAVDPSCYGSPAVKASPRLRSFPTNGQMIYQVIAILRCPLKTHKMRTPVSPTNLQSGRIQLHSKLIDTTFSSWNSCPWSWQNDRTPRGRLCLKHGIFKRAVGAKEKEWTKGLRWSPGFLLVWATVKEVPKKSQGLQYCLQTPRKYSYRIDKENFQGAPEWFGNKRTRGTSPSTKRKGSTHPICYLFGDGMGAHRDTVGVTWPTATSSRL